MKVLVTGGAGFVGSYLTEVLIRARYQVLVVSDGARTFVPKSARFLKLDVRSPKFKTALASFAPEYVCHVAGLVGPADLSEAAQSADVNIVGSLNVAEAALAAHVRKLLFVSSAAAYGESQNFPTPESAPLQPVSPYGLAKLAVENYLKYFTGLGLPSVIVRLANVYGPRQRSGGARFVVGELAQQVLKGHTIKLTGKGDVTRDFVYVTDAAEAMVRALEHGHGVYNVGSGSEMSLRELVVALGEVAGVVPKVSYTPAPPGELARSCLDISKARRELGWEPVMPLTEGLRLTLKWQREWMD